MPHIPSGPRAVNTTFSEPPTENIKAAGTVTLETDGRAWLAEPTNHYGGAKITFPKKQRDRSRQIDPRQTAIKATREKTGLKVELVDFLCDAGKDNATRYYIAKRIGGSPLDVGWKSQSVKLAPLDQLPDLFSANHRPYRDLQVMVALAEHIRNHSGNP